MKTNSEIYKRLYKDYSKKYLNKIIISLFFSILVAGSTSAIAWLLDPAIKKIFIDRDETLIYTIPILIVLAFSAKGISLYIAKATMISVGEEVKKKLQFDMTKSLINADTQLIENRHSGKFISNLTYDVTHITNLLSNAILTLFKDSLTLIGLLFVMFFQNWKLALISIIMIPLASFASKILGKRMKKITTEAQEKSGYLTSYLVELFKNHKLIKIFQKEKYEKLRANNYINNLKESTKKIATIFLRTSPIMEFLTGIMIAFLIFISAKLVAKNELEVSNFFSFLAAMMLAYQPVRSLATLNVTIQQGISGAARVIPIIDHKNKIYENTEDKNLEIINGDIEFKDVNFHYNRNEKKTLKSINLKIPGKKITSLVGHSGAGKTTILNLIPRFYNIDSGDIKIDGQSIFKTKIFSLRKNISLVSQDTTLFDDTIKNNIAYANPEASQNEIEEAAKFSFADEFIQKLPNRYDTIVGENGVRLSGGEKQRISIARAILKKSPIILLDEATSSLDAETEDKIQKAITFLTKGRTTVVIAHRLSTILGSDKIFVIDNGEVLDEGNHLELIENSKIYKNFYDKQIQK